MEVRKAIIWTLVNTSKTIHPTLTAEEKTIRGVMPLIEALFPGINYFSISGYSQVLVSCVIPALKKLHPELVAMPQESVSANDMIDVQAILPSEGYEWQNNPEWGSKFKTLLAA